MTNRIQSNESSPEPLHGVVEAFLDGEIVDPSLLRIALADQPARDHFVDLLVIRAAVLGLDSAVSVGHAPERGGRVRRLAAIAASAIVSVSLGYFAGQRVMASTATPATVEAVVVVDSVPAAPRPTRSISLKPGLNWTENSGGR